MRTAVHGAGEAFVLGHVGASPAVLRHLTDTDAPGSARTSDFDAAGLLDVVQHAGRARARAGLRLVVETAGGGTGCPGCGVIAEARGRRVQQDQCGHRGRKHDPLYRIRNPLRAGADRLTARQIERIEAGLNAGDRRGCG